MKKHTALSLLVLIVFATLAIGSFGKSEDEKREEEEAKGTAEMGETVTFDDSEWVVLEARDAGATLKSNNQFQEDAKTDGKFVIVKFKVKNKGKKEDQLFLKLELLDDDGREFRQRDEAAFYVPKGAKTIGLEALPPSMAKEFWTVFEIPADSKGLRFRTRSLASNDDTKLVSLGF